MIKVSNNKSLALKEIEMLESINHPNVVRFVETFVHTNNQHAIVTEYCSGMYTMSSHKSIQVVTSNSSSKIMAGKRKT